MRTERGRVFIILLLVGGGLFGCAEQTFDRAALPPEISLETDAEETAGVIGGDLVGPNPETHERSVVAIEMQDKDGKPVTICTGTLIAIDAILTAAHCVHPDEFPTVTKRIVHFQQNLRGVIGATLPHERRAGEVLGKRDPTLERAVRDIVIHELFNSKSHMVSWSVKNADGTTTLVPGLAKTLDHDIAVVFMEGKAPAVARVATLAGREKTFVPAQKLRVYGYGQSIDMLAISRSLEALRMYRMQRGDVALEAKPAAYHLATRPDSMSSVCIGDSGGPAFSFGKEGVRLAAVISATDTFTSAKTHKDLVPGLRLCKGRALLTSVPEHREWIDQNLRLYSKQP